MKYLNVSKVKARAHELGKRVSPSYLHYLDHKVHMMIRSHAELLGTTRTLNAEDVEIATEFNRSVRR